MLVLDIFHNALGDEIFDNIPNIIKERDIIDFYKPFLKQEYVDEIYPDFHNLAEYNCSEYPPELIWDKTIEEILEFLIALANGNFENMLIERYDALFAIQMTENYGNSANGKIYTELDYRLAVEIFSIQSSRINELLTTKSLEPTLFYGNIKYMYRFSHRKKLLNLGLSPVEAWKTVKIKYSKKVSEYSSELKFLSTIDQNGIVNE